MRTVMTLSDDWVACEVNGPLGLAKVEGPRCDAIRISEQARYAAGFRNEP